MLTRTDIETQLAGGKAEKIVWEWMQSHQLKGDVLGWLGFAKSRLRQTYKDVVMKPDVDSLREVYGRVPNSGSAEDLLKVTLDALYKERVLHSQNPPQLPPKTQEVLSEFGLGQTR